MLEPQREQVAVTLTNSPYPDNDVTTTSGEGIRIGEKLTSKNRISYGDLTRADILLDHRH